MELRYRFALASGARKEYAVRLDPETLACETPPGPPPDWTRLEVRQCPNCPLKPAEHPRCPVAVNIAPLVEEFKDSISYDEAEISVESPGRSYSKRAPMQTGISGLFGLVMATSGCPVLDKMRPMVFTHLPFPSLEESLYRSLSMYLLGQHFAAAKGAKPDWNLAGLSRIFSEVAKVNQAFAQRLRSISMRDANMNALAKLDCFAAFAVSAIDKKSLHWLERLFKPYWS